MEQRNEIQYCWDKDEQTSCLISDEIGVITVGKLENEIGIDKLANAIVRHRYAGGGMTEYTLMDWLKVNGTINELIEMQAFWVQVKKEFNENGKFLLCSSRLFQSLWVKDIIKCNLGGYNITQSQTCELVRSKAKEYVEGNKYATLFYASNSQSLFKQITPYAYEMYANFSSMNKELRNGFLDYMIAKTGK